MRWSGFRFDRGSWCTIDGMGRLKLRTAVYRDRIAGNPARIIRDKEGDDRGNVIGLANGDRDPLV